MDEKCNIVLCYAGFSPNNTKASVTFGVNFLSPPGGTCSVSPKLGYALATKFIFNCTHDAGNRHSLKYRFFIQEKGNFVDNFKCSAMLCIYYSL